MTVYQPPCLCTIALRSALEKMYLAREVGFEPTTNRLTVDCSTVELLPNIVEFYGIIAFFCQPVNKS